MNQPPVLDRARIVLVRPRHPGNIGSAARAMLTMGIARLYLVAPEQFPDKKADVMAASAIDVLKRATLTRTLDEALAGVRLSVGVTARQRELAVRMLDCREAARQIAAELAANAGEVALVFGPEVYGLSNAELDYCQLLLTISTNPGYGSLNLAAAVQVVCYELRMALSIDPAPSFFTDELATHEEIEGFHRHLEETLYRIEFLRPELPQRVTRRLRRLFARTRLEREEVNILRGILKQVNLLAEETAANAANSAARAAPSGVLHCDNAAGERK